MKKYYDTILTPQTEKIFSEDGENRIIETDERVKSWFEKLPSGYKRAFTVEGLPFNELIPPPPEPTQEELDLIEEQNKIKQLNSLIVTTQSGKRFYADPKSRTDLDGAVMHGMLNNATDETQEHWKTASRAEGTSYEIVTFAEMKEASRLALEAKGQIVGVN